MKVDDEETALVAVLQQGEDLPIEGLIFPQLLMEGIGQRCYYCWTKTGYSVAFTSLDQYAKHVLYNHEGYSIYVFDEDVKKYNKELKVLCRKEMDYPKQFRQPTAGVKTDTKYCSRYSIFYKNKKLSN